MQTALITGGTGGLGSAVTQTFLADGFRCVVPYRKSQDAQRLRDLISAPEQLQQLNLVKADLFDQSDVGDVIQASQSPEAPLAAVVNLVGGFDAGPPMHETPVTRFEEQLRVNLRATYLVCSAALPLLLDRGQGAIVCVSSKAAIQPFPGAVGYVTSKAAVLAFVDALASEYTAAGIRVNAVLPSIIDTPTNRASQPDSNHDAWVKPEEIAKVISFLCSPQANPISGAHVPVYGHA
jgi:NAD(P)-dependent dehydrogenase (short-subunit alcohol dehydrogenase family)